VLSLADIFGLGDTAQATAARIDRQAALYDEARSFEFVITEAALRYQPGPPEVMLAQLDKLISISTLPTASIAIIMSGYQASAVQAHPFVIYELSDGSALVTIETYTRELTLTDGEEVRMYQQIYSSLRTDA